MRFFRFLSHVLPLTFGIMLTLVGLTFLVEFLDSGLRFNEEFFAFVVWFVLGFPVIYRDQCDHLIANFGA